MTHYQVKVFMPGAQEWVYVRAIEYVAGQMVIRINSAERLTKAEADARCSDLSDQHRAFNFMVTEENY